MAWPRLTKEDIKVGSGLLFLLCSLPVYAGAQVRSGNRRSLLFPPTFSHSLGPASLTSWIISNPFLYLFLIQASCKFVVYFQLAPDLFNALLPFWSV